jgi:hypothetical protein
MRGPVVVVRQFCILQDIKRWQEVGSTDASDGEEGGTECLGELLAVEVLNGT